MIDGTIEGLDNYWTPTMRISFSKNEDY